MSKILRLAVVFLLVLPVGFGCATMNKKPREEKENKSEKKEKPEKNSKDKNDKDDKEKKSEAKDKKDEVVKTGFGDMVLYVFSRSGNKQTSHAYDKGRAEALSEKLGAASDKDQRSIALIMSSKRLAGKGVNVALNFGKKITAIEQMKNIEADVPDYVKAELVMTGIQANKLEFAEHYIAELKQSKNRNALATAYNAEGVIFALDGNIQEAEISWKKAVEIVPGFEAAALNLAFTGLRYGDFKQARQILGTMPEDWFTNYGLISAERMSRKSTRPATLCDKVLQSQPKNKAVLYNCGLYEFQNNNDYDKAKDYFTRVTKIPTLSTEIDERAYSQLSQIDEAKAKARDKAKERAK